MNLEESTSPVREVNSRSVMVLLVLTIIVTLLYTLIALIALLTPLYNLHGVVDGYVSFMRYSLKYYGVEIQVPALDAVKILSIPLFTVCCLMLVSSIYAVASLFKRSLKYFRIVHELFLGSNLSALVTAPLLFNLLRVIEIEVKGLIVNNVFTSSAGTVYFGSTMLIANTPVLELLKPLYIYVLIAVMLALTILLGRKLHII